MRYILPFYLMSPVTGEEKGVPFCETIGIVNIKCAIFWVSYLKLSHLVLPSSLEATVDVKSGKHAVASNMHKQQKLDHC